MHWNKRLFGMPLILAAGSWLASPLSATEVSGLVLDRDGYSQPGVRIDFFGATSHVVLTDAAGNFRVTLPGGSYQVRVSAGMRRFESRHRVEDVGQQELELRVDW